MLYHLVCVKPFGICYTILYMLREYERYTFYVFLYNVVFFPVSKYLATLVQRYGILCILMYVTSHLLL
jgi:hypothetical protein